MTTTARIIDEHRLASRGVGGGEVIAYCRCGVSSRGNANSEPVDSENNAHRSADRKHAQHVADELAWADGDRLGELEEAARKIEAALDDMDGGVAAARVEEEVEQRVADPHAEKSAQFWHDRWQEAAAQRDRRDAMAALWKEAARYQLAKIADRDDAHASCHWDSLVQADEVSAWRERAEEAEKERDEAFAHDRQPYPTAAAYEAVCAALRKQRARAEKAEQTIEHLREEMAACDACSGVIEVTDEMVERALRAGGYSTEMPANWGSMRTVLIAALAPPAPEWLADAEPIEALLREIEGVGFVTDPVLLSRHLAERGVRVEGQS